MEPAATNNHMGVLRQWIGRTTTVEWLVLQRAFVRHLLALLMVVGFLTLAVLEMVGAVYVRDATVAGFLGVALGFLSAKLDYVVKFYFGRPSAEPGFLDQTKAGTTTKDGGTPAASP